VLYKSMAINSLCRSFTEPLGYRLGAYSL